MVRHQLDANGYIKLNTMLMVPLKETKPLLQKIHFTSVIEEILHWISHLCRC